MVVGLAHGGVRVSGKRPRVSSAAPADMVAAGGAPAMATAAALELMGSGGVDWVGMNPSPPTPRLFRARNRRLHAHKLSEPRVHGIPCAWYRARGHGVFRNFDMSDFC